MLICSGAFAADLSIVSGDTGNGREFLRKQLDRFEKETGDESENSRDACKQLRPVWPVQAFARRREYRTSMSTARM